MENTDKKLKKNENNQKTIPENDCEGHRKRLRDKFINSGITALSDYELLELLLTYSIPRRDVKPQAKMLMKKFSSISAIFSADPSEIISVKGLGKKSVALIKLIHACHVKYFEEKMLYGNPLSNPEDVINFAKVSLSALTEENMMEIFVNSKNKVVGYEIVSVGTIDVAVVYPRKIIKKALDKNSNGIILVHNHPGGDPEPSNQDINLTKSIKTISEQMDIRFLDHIIVGNEGYFSMKEKRILF